MTDPYEGYAIVELMGHRRLAGRASQAEQYGVAMLRLDVPHKDGTESTHFYSGPSIYAVHPTSEEVARQVAASYDPALGAAGVARAIPRRGLRRGDDFEDDPDPYDEVDDDDQPEGEPPDIKAEAAAEASTEPCAICKPGHLCVEHEPF